MPVNNRVADLAVEVTEWRRYLHTIPEIAFQEFKTSAFVQEKLTAFGVDEIHTGYATTGVVAVIKAGSSSRTIGLRADMDALPMDELADVPYKSTHDGAMHACGHDSHTSMLLGTAKYLSETRNFDGTVYLYFQPAEEDGNGADVMIQDGLFKDFPPDEVYGLHTCPGLPIGQYSVTSGPVMAAPDAFAITIQGKGGHAAYPHDSIDPIMIANQIYTAYQTLVSRNTDPLDNIVLSVTKFNAGTANNVIPHSAELGGTVRTFNPQLREDTAKRMQDMAEQIAGAYGATVDFNYIFECAPTINHAEQSQIARDICTQIVGAENVVDLGKNMGAEDFSFMLENAPGAFVFMGNGDSHDVHHPEFVFNDETLKYGIDFFVQLVEARLAR